MRRGGEAATLVHPSGGSRTTRYKKQIGATKRTRLSKDGVVSPRSSLQRVSDSAGRRKKNRRTESGGDLRPATLPRQKPFCERSAERAWKSRRMGVARKSLSRGLTFQLNGRWRSIISSFRTNETYHVK